MAFADKQISCRDCSTMFVFTAGEQEFYANKGLMNEPTRCQSCRSAKPTMATSAMATSPASAARRRARCTRPAAPIAAR
ncbi:MAG TPA: zinc-ribbon domain-containing protein [Tepidiformaceae bacterium]|nr:zinc-ribbon domain-containing protein [Tepidiformaceae bacterium]